MIDPILSLPNSDELSFERKNSNARESVIFHQAKSYRDCGLVLQ